MQVDFHNPKKNSSYITLQDICMKPLDPYNSNCSVLSALQWWQNDVKKLNMCISLFGDCVSTPTFTNIRASWGDHLIQCAK